MLLLELIAEQKLREAVDRGELDNLPGAGHPLNLDEDPLVPEELRLANRILKNAGILPPEVVVRREIEELERAIQRMDESGARSRAMRRLQALAVKLAESRASRAPLSIGRGYYDKLLKKLG
jgi:hypothetical protein